MAKVGIFFVVGTVLLMEAIDSQKATLYGEFLVCDAGHDDVWEKQYRKMYCKDYDYYPRGRVVYHLGKDMFIVYVDKCIEVSQRELIIEEFGLKEEQVVFETDAHYVCSRCNEDYVDLKR